MYVYRLVGIRRIMLANARQFIPVRIAQIGNIKVGAVGGPCSGLAFIFPSRTESRCMEASDNVRVICSESEHCPVSRRRGLLVKWRTNTEAKFVIRMIFVSPHCPAISPGGQTRIAQHVKNSVIKVHGALKVICPNRDISQHFKHPLFRQSEQRLSQSSYLYHHPGQDHRHASVGRLGDKKCWLTPSCADNTKTV